jgi:hypothetical protein
MLIGQLFGGNLVLFDPLASSFKVRADCLDRNPLAKAILDQRSIR